MAKKKKTSENIDVLSHTLVPEMEVLSGDEKQRVLKKFGISGWQLPKILFTDSGAVALKANVNDIIKITRSDSTGKTVNYRLVI